MSTYSQFQEQVASEKIGLVILGAAQRLVGWSLYSGSIYRVAFSYAKITELSDDGTALTVAASVSAITAGKYYLDRDSSYLYARLSDSSDPASSFIGVKFQMFFSNKGVAAPHDLSTGFDVYWAPLLKSTSKFGVELEKNQIGFAIEGSGSVTFYNDQSFWRPIYDKLTFENQRLLVYSWSTGLAITEAKLLYDGRIQKKTYSESAVTFQAKDIINELRAPLPTSNIESIVGARVPESLYNAKQRILYGRVQGHVPTNIDQVLDGYPMAGTVSVTSGSTLVTGSSTEFLSKLNPEDSIVVTVNGEVYELSIKTIYSNTRLYLSEEFEGNTTSGLSYSVLPDEPKNYINRVFKIAGHELTQPETEIVSALSLKILELDDSSGIRPGDPIYVDGAQRIVSTVSGGNIIKITQNLSSTPIPGDVVYRPAVSGVYIDSLEINPTDYTVDEEAATLTLDSDAEANAAPVQSVTGVCTFMGAVINSQNKSIDFYDSAERNGTLTEGSYTPAALATHLQTVMDALSANTITCTFSSVTGKFTFGSNGATFRLLWQSGANASTSVGLHLGFDTSADDTGSLSYVGDDVSEVARAVVGSGTKFTTQLKHGDLIKKSTESTWSEILEIREGNYLLTRALLGYTSTGPSEYKGLVVYEEDETTLSMNCLGVSDTGQSTGALLYRGPEIVQDILSRVGIEDSRVDSDSFDTANNTAEHDVSFVVPEKLSDTGVKSCRDYINAINHSIFGSLFQDNDFLLSYGVVDPARTSSLTKVDESDILKISIGSDSSSLVKTIVLEYGFREFDKDSLDSVTLSVTDTSESVENLGSTEKEKKVETVLRSSESAGVYASRWALLLEQASSEVSIDLKMQGARLAVNDRILISHPKLYERMGSSSSRKVAAVNSIKKSFSGTEIVLDDLGNSFTRVATIADNDAADYGDAEEDERAIFGYITDNSGLLGSDTETHGTSLIW